MADTNSSSPSISGDDFGIFPSNFKFVNVLGEGGFGKVVKCWKKDTKQNVAIKIPKCHGQEEREIMMMRKFMNHDFKHRNIVEFFGWFHTSHGRAMVFEVLDISLEDYVVKICHAPMRLSDISTIVRQLATALEALKSVGVIHTDLKPDNVMLVNRWKRPFQVKLIDFGLAIPKSEARTGMTLQTTFFRAPEIILGLPFSEAIDMWSLGCLMAAVVLCRIVFPGNTEYETLRYIIALLGQPADHLLNEGLKTKRFFTRTETNSWRLKTEEEYWGSCPHRSHSSYIKTSLDELKQVRLEKRNKAEAVERQQCIDLLEAMLKLDPSERITPSEVLTHPFIAKDLHSSHMKKNKSWSKMIKRKRKIAPTGDPIPPPPLARPVAAMSFLKMDNDVESSLQTPRNNKSRGVAINIHPDHQSPSSPAVLPSGVILVRPAAAENMLQIEDEESKVSLQADTSKSSSVELTESEPTSRTNDTSSPTAQKKKKKKNCVRRFFSCLRKIFSRCTNKDVDAAAETVRDKPVL